MIALSIPDAGSTETLAPIRVGDLSARPIDRLFGGIGPRSNGAPILAAKLRSIFWRVLAMGLTVGIGLLVGTAE